jgi:hypothetical protein
MGRPAGRRLVRRRVGSSPYYCAAADLCCAAADHCRPSCNSPAASRGRPTAACGSSARGRGPTAAIDRRAARRGIAAADRGSAAARRRCCSGAASGHPHATRLRALYRSSGPDLRDNRTCLVAWWVYHRRCGGLRRDGSDSAFRPQGFCRGTRRLLRPTAGPASLGLGRGLARPWLWRRAWWGRLARWGLARWRRMARWGLARGSRRRLRPRPWPRLALSRGGRYVFYKV